jgi:pyruvate dehydrogenase E2 component (dihydrolipoamide acetyltransferase)
VSTTDFHLPDLGEGLIEAEIISWHVAAGDHVVADQPLVSVETDKAVVEIPAPQSGTVVRLHGEPGDRIEVGALLVEFDSARTDSGAIVGDLVGATPSAPDQPPDQVPVRVELKASPAARRRARELGVALEHVAGSGPGGVIQVTDIERNTDSLPTSPNAEALRGVRRAMARRMADAHLRVAAASVTGEANVSSWHQEGSPLSRLVRAVGEACRAEPRLNVAFDDVNMTVRAADQVDLGIAMETADGLFVPVLRDVAARNADDLAEGIERMKEDVRKRSIPAAELRGQTITLSNYGAVAGIHSAMIVVPPQVAIVGAGRVSMRPVLEQGQLREHAFLPLSITFDHRVVTGVETCRFLGALVEDLERET